MADSYMSLQATQGDALSVPVKAAAVYAAQENSLFLSGQLFPIVNAPNGIIRVGELASVTATKLSAVSTPEDISPTNPALTKNDIQADLFVARAVVRQLGNIDLNEVGFSLGKAVQVKFDGSIYESLDTNATEYDFNTTGTGTTFSLDDVFEAVKVIRQNGEQGKLYGILNPTIAKDLMKDIGSTAYAGGDFQSQAMREGFLGQVAGVAMFSSAMAGTTLTNGSSGFIFGADSGRIAMQKGIDVATAPRVEAVGTDIVCNLHAGFGFLDANRAVRLRSVA